MTNGCTHPELNDLLVLYHENDLEETAMHKVQNHVTECRRCREDLDGLSQILGVLLHNSDLLARSVQPCIDAELLTRYARNTAELSPAERDRIDAHLPACAECRSLMETLTGLDDLHSAEGIADVPLSAGAFLNMALSRYPKTPGLLERLQDCLDGWREEFHAGVSALLFPRPQAVLVRNTRPIDSDAITVISDSSNGIGIRLEIETRDEGCTLLVLLEASTGKIPLDDIRASLFSGDTEIASIFVEDGKAAFRNIPGGSYDLALLRDGQEIKRIAFSTGGADN